MNIREEIMRMKEVAPILATSTNEDRNRALSYIVDALQEKKDLIFAENAKDMQKAAEDEISAAVKGRLKFDEGKLSSVCDGIRQLIDLSDPIGKVTIDRQLDSDLHLRRVSCPIGVIGVIFEARPDAMVQIASLCIKSGNCAILKGGKETLHSNRILFSVIREAFTRAGLPEECLMLLEAHCEIDELLTCEGYVDLLIPRGSNAFVRYIMDNTRIPVMGHADGICHIYLDESANLSKAIPILLDAKMQYTSACNAVETILIHKNISEKALRLIGDEFAKNGIMVRGDENVRAILDSASDLVDGRYMEYLDLCASVKVVDSIEEAISHINRFGSHHTDSILTEDDDKARIFMQFVDSANVYRNCSTRFSDGFRYGFGAEVGVSTSKFHARGPVGLEGLMTYKYMLEGAGNIVGDYAEGRKHFHFVDCI